jgi:glutathione synthase
MRDAAVVGHQRRYCLLQDYVPRAQEGVTRVLVAGGDVVTVLQEVAIRIRSSLRRRRELNRVDALTAEEGMAIEMARDLQRYGVNFAGLDIVYPYLLEVNLCNPGGIQNAPASRVDDLVARVLDAILLRFTHRSE